MNVLVTGGAGYIGSLAVKKCLNKGYNVIVIDDLSTGYYEALENLDITFYEKSICDKSSLYSIFEKHKIDLIMDFAAKLIVEESFNKVQEYYEVNVLGLKNILDAMVKFSVSKIIFSSTAAVYGLLDKKDKLIVESDITIPVNPYGESKLIGEKMIVDYSKCYKIDYIIFRYFNVLGNVKYGEKLSNITSVVPTILDSIFNDKKFLINGSDYNTLDGTCVRDFIHLEDLVNAHILVTDKINSSNSGIYNLGIGVGTSILELIKLSETALNEKINFDFVDRRVGDPIISAASNEKFINTFDWEIIYTNVGEMVKQTFDAWKEYE